MPELPEVETTRRGIAPHIVGKTVRQVTVRNPALRWPVPEDFAWQLQGHAVLSVSRRGKYLLLGFKHGTALCHLGMSGSVRIVSDSEPLAVHDHVELRFSRKLIVRFNDPRRFGLWLWTDADPLQHPLLKNLGPEPLEQDFDGDYLFRRSRKRKIPVKQFLMDSKTVVGVGNIYANEALFFSGVRPSRPAGKVTRREYHALVEHIRAVLSRAIQQGGTTLKDFVGGDGKPGYFQQQLSVYGRGGESCAVCGTILKEIRLGQRATVYCPRCQS